MAEAEVVQQTQMVVTAAPEEEVDIMEMVAQVIPHPYHHHREIMAAVVPQVAVEEEEAAAVLEQLVITEHLVLAVTVAPEHLAIFLGLLSLMLVEVEVGHGPVVQVVQVVQVAAAPGAVCLEVLKQPVQRIQVEVEVEMDNLLPVATAAPVL
jgi:hypothetical protein